MADLAALIARLRELRELPRLTDEQLLEMCSALPELLRVAEAWQRVLKLRVDDTVKTLAAFGARVGMLIEDVQAVPLGSAPAWWMDRDQALATPAPPPDCGGYGPLPHWKRQTPAPAPWTPTVGERVRVGGETGVLTGGRHGEDWQIRCDGRYRWLPLSALAPLEAPPAPPPVRTAEQERARVVDAARRLSRRSSDAGAATLLDAFALVIERGEHWPETGEERDRGEESCHPGCRAVTGRDLRGYP